MTQLIKALQKIFGQYEWIQEAQDDEKNCNCHHDCPDHHYNLICDAYSGLEYNEFEPYFNSIIYDKETHEVSVYGASIGLISIGKYKVIDQLNDILKHINYSKPLYIHGQYINSPKSNGLLTDQTI